MSYEVVQKVGKYQYIYLAEGYRNAEGKSRQKRKIIGKLDANTGEKIYKPEYLEQIQDPKDNKATISALTKTFSVDDIQKSTVLSYGQSYLFQKIAERLKLIEALKESVPDHWKEIFTLACYMISTSDPLMYCNEWMKDTETLESGSLSSQRISELLISLRPEEREAFYQKWYLNHEENGYLALDITSESSYSKLIEDVEWGYNRDHEQLPQINLCMLMGESSRLPIYQTVYSGSNKDVSTLVTTLSKFLLITKDRPVTVVMDKGFFSTKNINYLLGDSGRNPVKFLISMPFTSSFARRQIESERKDIDCAEKTIVVNGISMRAVTKVRAWNKEHNVFTHIFFSAQKAAAIREDLFAEIAMLRQKVTLDPEKYIHDEECTKYLIIRKSEKQDLGYTVSIRNDVIEKALETAGWVVLISNNISDAQTAIQIYRDKDVVEKGFLRQKNSIDLGRLRVHSDNAMQGKQFIGFIASILMSEINRVMVLKNLFKKFTMHELLLILSKNRIQYFEDKRVLFPLTKDQKQIFDAFDIDFPSV